MQPHNIQNLTLLNSMSSPFGKLAQGGVRLDLCSREAPQISWMYILDTCKTHVYYRQMLQY